ncbi:hypothetical protein E3U43_019324 [Larimichthys crocea]|nr:hypothetical protein E3U43_019324 [Larimichthys crocea]
MKCERQQEGLTMPRPSSTNQPILDRYRPVSHLLQTDLLLGYRSLPVLVLHVSFFKSDIISCFLWHFLSCEQEVPNDQTARIQLDPPGSGDIFKGTACANRGLA